MGNQRIGCLLVPQLPLSALLRAEPELLNAPVALTDGRGSRCPVVCAASREARQAGIGLGMTAAQARSLLPELVLRPLSAAQVRSAQAALLDVARWASPRVVLESTGEACLDLSGLGSLFPSEQALGSALIAKARQMGLEIWVGIGSSRFVALLAARTARGEVPQTSPATEGLKVVPVGQERSFLAPLPLSLLEAPADLHAKLYRFGIERLGQLAGLPPRSLGCRLGPDGLRLWRLARGEDPRPLMSVRPPERFAEETDTPYPLDRVEPLLFVLQGALERLSERLRLRGMVARGLFLSLGLDPVGSDERSLSLAFPTRWVRTWLVVVRLSLEAQPPRAAVTTVRVQAEAVPERHNQLDLFVPTGPVPARLEDTIARLATLSGQQRVGSPRVVDSHRPGEFTVLPFAFRSAAGESFFLACAGTAEPALRAVRPPGEVEVQLRGSRPIFLRGERIRGKVSQSAGPWCLEGEWWEEEGLSRDYYEVELSDGGIYRIYRERGTTRWFVDGVYG